MEAKERYDGRGALSTYATPWIKKRMFEEMRANARFGITWLPKPLTRCTLVDSVEEREAYKPCDLERYAALLSDPRHKQLFQLLYVSCLSVTEAAVAMDVSRAAAFRLKRELLYKLAVQLREQPGTSPAST